MSEKKEDSTFEIDVPGAPAPTAGWEPIKPVLMETLKKATNYAQQILDERSGEVPYEKSAGQRAWERDNPNSKEKF